MPIVVVVASLCTALAVRFLTILSPSSVFPHLESFGWSELNDLEQASTGSGRRSATHSLTLLLHDLADLHRRVEKLGSAAVQADRLSLVQLSFAVIGGDALLLTGTL